MLILCSSPPHSTLLRPIPAKIEFSSKYWIDLAWMSLSRLEEGSRKAFLNRGFNINSALLFGDGLERVADPQTYFKFTKSKSHGLRCGRNATICKLTSPEKPQVENYRNSDRLLVTVICSRCSVWENNCPRICHG